MFAAKLATQLLDSEELSRKLAVMERNLPESYFIQFYQGQLSYEGGDLISALVYFDAALTLKPAAEDIPYIYSYKGSCLRDMEQFEEAIEALKLGLEADEERPDMHNTIGVCYFKQEQYDQAVTHFTRAVELNPVSAIDYANLALNLEKLGKDEQAIEQYQVALGLDSSITFAMERLEQLLAKEAGV